MSMTSFNKETLEELRQAYLKAVEDGKSSFVFKDADVFTSYAKYLVEYLDSKFYPKK